MVERVSYAQLQKKTKLKIIVDEQSQQWNRMRIAERQAAGKGSRSMYASDYGQCMRKVWFQFFPSQYRVEDFDPRTLRIFHNGELVHERLSGYLKNDPTIQFNDEIDVPRDELDVHGRCDGMCIVDDRPVVTEFKSINRKVVLEPKEEHLGQLTWYMSMWKKHRKAVKEWFGMKETDAFFNADIVLTDDMSMSDFIGEHFDSTENWLLFTQGEIRGELIYESKQTNETFHFVVEYDEAYAEKVRMWFEQLDWHVKRAIRPEVFYDKTKFPCQWGSGTSAGQCPYYDVCWGFK